jgi:hypothetical protein
MAKSALLIPVAMPRENDVSMSALEAIKCCENIHCHFSPHLMSMFWGSASIYP